MHGRLFLKAHSIASDAKLRWWSIPCQGPQKIDYSSRPDASSHKIYVIFRWHQRTSAVTSSSCPKSTAFSKITATYSSFIAVSS